MTTAAYRFAEICEAYDVLSNCKFLIFIFNAIVERKAIYDDYGESVLKFGGVTPQGCKFII